MTDFNMPPGVSARDIPGQDEAPDLVDQLQAAASRASWPEDADLMTEAGAEIDRLRAEVEALRGAVLWVLWHHQGGSSPVGQPIRRALGIGAHDRLSDGQVQAAMQWAMQWAAATRAKEKE